MAQKRKRETSKIKVTRAKNRPKHPRTSLRLAKALGRRIKEVRKSKGISLKHFEAIEHSISRSALSEIENGKRIPSLITTFRIARTLNVPLSDLFEGISYE